MHASFLLHAYLSLSVLSVCWFTWWKNKKKIWVLPHTANFGSITSQHQQKNIYSGWWNRNNRTIIIIQLGSASARIMWTIEKSESENSFKKTSHERKSIKVSFFAFFLTFPSSACDLCEREKSLCLNTWICNNSPELISITVAYYSAIAQLVFWAQFKNYSHSFIHAQNNQSATDSLFPPCERSLYMVCFPSLFSGPLIPLFALCKRGDFLFLFITTGFSLSCFFLIIIILCH